MEEICNECGRVFSSLNALALHVRTKHDYQQYYDDYFGNDRDGVCRCGRETQFVSWKEGYRTYCCRECRYSDSESHPMYGRTGKKSPLFGRRHSATTIKKMSEAHKGDKNPFYRHAHTSSQKEKWSKERSGEGHPMYGRTGEKSPLFGRPGRQLSDEARTRISETLARRYANGEITVHNRYVHGRFESQRFNRVFWYRSSYELRALEKLEVDSGVVDLEMEALLIEYWFDGTTRYYVPDFKVTRRESVEIIEVKPKRLLKKAICQAKIEALKKYCKENGYVPKIWTETELGIDG